MLVLPELFRIPFINLPIHTYGALYVLGLLTGLFVAHRQALLGKKYQDYIWDVGFWILLGALIGARILFIIVEYKYYFIDEPFTTLPMLNISIPTFLALHKGGFVFFGGAIGGTLALFLFCKKHKIPFSQMGDFFVLGLPLGHAIGRIGCIAGGCCYGQARYHLDALGQVIADVPFALKFPPKSIAFNSLYPEADSATKNLMDQLGSTLPLFPVQIVESLANVGIFLILFFLTPFKRAHGQITCLYIIFYALLRIFTETLRGDEARGFILGLSTSQFIALIVCLLSLTMLFKLNKSESFKNKI